MIKEINGTTYINEKSDFMVFVVNEDGSVYITLADRHKPEGNVAFFRGGLFDEKPGSAVQLPYVTEADAPSDPPNGTFVGTQKRVWIVETETWMGYFKLNYDRVKEERRKKEESVSD